MRVVATVLRSAFVRERLVETDVVAVNAIDTVRAANKWRRRPQVTNEGSYRDVHNVVAEAAPVGPTAGDQSAVVNGSWIWLWKRIATEDAQPRETGIIWIRRVPRPAAGETHARSRQVDLDQIGDVDTRDIGAICLNPVRIRAGGRPNTILLIRNASSGVSAYLRKSRLSTVGLVRL